jgi:ketosteroid isomerase-like protein
MNAIIPHLISALPLDAVLGLCATGSASLADDARVVGELDLRFQDAVKRNDAEAMAEIFHQDVVLVVGSGMVFTREDMLNEARSGAMVYEQQDEEPGSQTVRVWGDTAVVTAKLWIKGTENGEPFDRKIWFSDTYVRTARGWRYFFAQSTSVLATSVLVTPDAG